MCDFGDVTMKLRTSLTLLFTLMTLTLFGLSACSGEDDDGGNVVAPIDPNFVDLDLAVGYHCFCWNQRIDGQTTSVGEYAIRMVAGSYDNTWDFRIRNGIARSRPPECCDTATISLEKSLKDPPEFFGLEMVRDTVAWQDTVYFEVAVPADSRVKLEIKRIGD